MTLLDQSINQPWIKEKSNARSTCCSKPTRHWQSGKHSLMVSRSMAEQRVMKKPTLHELEWSALDGIEWLNEASEDWHLGPCFQVWGLRTPLGAPRTMQRSVDWFDVQQLSRQTNSPHLGEDCWSRNLNQLASIKSQAACRPWTPPYSMT